MERLVHGKAVRSDGELTVKSLSAEAGVKGWLVTHDQTDLQHEHRARRDAQNLLVRLSRPASMESDLPRSAARSGESGPLLGADPFGHSCLAEAVEGAADAAVAVLHPCFTQSGGDLGWCQRTVGLTQHV